MMEIYYYWLIAAILLVVVEIFTSGFAVICFAIGAATAALFAFLGLSFNWQLFAMVVFSMVAFVGVRPFVLRWLARKDDLRTNTDALIGRICIVSEEINAELGTGRVAVDGDDWRAVSADASVISKGKRVKIVARDSLVLTVKEDI